MKMSTTDLCNVCGSKDLNLVDGFYYCVECGTQNTNVRETVIEQSRILADGQLTQSTKRKIINSDNEKIKMSGEWYKWHAYNFIICGLADELIALGAKPSFKIKLLWIWTKYVTKYQNKDEFGLTIVNETIAPSLLEKTKVIDSDEEFNIEDKMKTKSKNKDMSINPTRDIKTLSLSTLCSMLYVALNIDKSDIQLSHLFRFIKEGRLNMSNFDRFLPGDLDYKSIPNWVHFVKSCCLSTLIKSRTYRIKAMSFFKLLDLGSPVLPDMRKIVTNYITELSLPDEFKDVVFSLMHLWSCDFLEVEDRHLNNLCSIPDYEGVAMSYIVIALKMCFGLDDQYEYKLAHVVDNINTKNMYPRCYKLGFSSDSTKRMFSFREWIYCLQYRRKLLKKERLYTAEDEHYLDIDDYSYMENLLERPKRKPLLTDELSINIIKKIPMDEDISVIRKSDLPITFTPMTAYTEIIANHYKNHEALLLLNEDFKQYSLKYICGSMILTEVDDSKNIVTGVSDSKKVVTGKELIFDYLTDIKTYKKFKMVYIRNCDNKNWMKTNKPTISHVTLETNENDLIDNNDTDIDKDNGYVSNSDNMSNNAVEVADICESDELETIREEDDDKNIFDDLFLNIETSDDNQVQDDHFFDSIEEDIVMTEIQKDTLNHDDMEDNKSISSVNSFEFEFNPETFNRDRAIKELILHACKKYKIPIPKEYKTTEPKKRTYDHIDEVKEPRKYMKTSERTDNKQRVNKLLEAYYNYVKNDILNQAAKEVKEAIWEFNQNIPYEVPIEHGNEELGNGSLESNSVADNQEILKDINVSTLTEGNSISKIEHVEENIEPILFEDENDGCEIDDLVPKSDSKFDDKKYDVNQLYIKMNAIGSEDYPLQDPEIETILNREIQNSDKRQPVKLAKTEESDSEDELPLKIVKEHRDMCVKGKHVDDYEPLITNDSIPEYKYWVKHYTSSCLTRDLVVTTRFDQEMFDTTPRTFSFLLAECAAISGCKQFSLYQIVQHLEQNLILLVKGARDKGKRKSNKKSNGQII